MQVNIIELWKRRELLWIWTLRSIQARYKQTFFGSLWAIIQPLSMMLMFSIIFTFFIPVNTGPVPYPVFSFTALLPWTFFSTSIASAVPSMIDNMSLVTKVYFPREIFPLSAIGARFVDFLIGSIICVAMLIYYDIGFSKTWIWVPLLLVVQMTLTVGISLLGAAMTVFYRDFRYAFTLLLQLWMYATPIIYPITVVPEQFRGLYSLNPMVGLMTSYRSVILLGQNPSLEILAPAVVVSLVALAVGYWYFKRAEWQFGDII